MWGLTKEEKIVIVFLSASLATGSAVLWYKRHHPSYAPGLRDVRPLPRPRDDSLTISQSDSIFGVVQPARRREREMATISGPIDINRANPRTLERLPHIGPAMAKRIVEYRQAAGGFTSVDQLAQVKGIGPKKLDILRKHVTVEK